MVGLIFSDRALSQRLERAEATANARHVEARARLAPSLGACWIEVAGAYAMFDGVDSPCTQTFGLGLFDTPTPAHLDELEAFFRERDAEVFHETSPMADPALITLLGARGYKPVEYTSLLYASLPETQPPDSSIAVRVIGNDEADMWARVAADGWRQDTDFADLIYELARVGVERPEGASFLAEIDGTPAATGGLYLHDGVAVFAGASTVPAFRNRGAQNALLAARLRYATEHGCNLAMIGALPGSASQRNAQRNGFQIAYTRIKWGR